MIRPAISCRLTPAILLLAGLLPLSARELNGGHTARPLAPQTASNQRQFAPDRLVDIQHVAIDVTPDFPARSITAQTTLRFRPIAAPVRELKLDAVDLRIKRVQSTTPIRAWRNTDLQLIVTFESELSPDTETDLTIDYQAQPKQGLYFRVPEMGYPASDTHLFTQGEAILHRHWFPCFDAPNEKFTSEIICRVPSGMKVLSNGRLLAQETDPGTGLTAFHWRQDQPHVNYLIAIAAGYFEKLEDQYRDIPLSFHTPPSEFQWAANSFAGTRQMMEFFESEIGVPYPWAKYAQACVHDFVAGGMENTSLTILTTDTLFPTETENLRSSEGLVAHELAHQWFGDLVTCKDWSHLWLNEGFATYYAALFDGYRHGPDHFRYNLWLEAQTVLSVENDITPIVWRSFEHPDEQFSFRSYPKGAWVLHMLRSQLGENLFRRCVKTWLERHAYGVVVTEDFNAVIEELSGRSFDPFLDQWVYHAGHPELEIAYSWDELTRMAKLSVNQTQAINDHVLQFRFPLPVRFVTAAGVVSRTLDIQQLTEDFYIALPAAPQQVRVDPDLTVLVKTRIDLPTDLLYAQLEDPADMLGRLLATKTLSGQDSREAIDRLKRRLNEDPFYGVRLEASKALRETQSDQALAALLDSTQQPDARVRQQVYSDLGAFYSESVLHAALAAIEHERNPEVRATAMRLLATYGSAASREALLRFLSDDSFRNLVADAAIEAMRGQDDPLFIPPLLETLTAREPAFTTHGFGHALRALASLARNDENRDPVRTFLAAKLTHPKEAIRIAAIDALGTLGDPKALAKIEPFTRTTHDSPVRRAAHSAVSALRAGRPPTDDLRELRDEVLRLQQENRELTSGFEDLKKQFEEHRRPEPP